MIDLKSFSGLRVGGSAFDVLEMKNAEEVEKALQIIAKEGLRPYVIGEGTNTFWDDGVHEKLVLLKYTGSGINIYPRGDEIVVEAEAGMIWDELVGRVSEYGWGVEALAGIPGSVGAAPVQNIGAYGAEFVDVCTYISGYDINTGEKKIWRKDDCGFGYRKSIFNTSQIGKYLITRIQLVIARDRQHPLPREAIDAHTPLEVALRIRAVRAAKLPDYKTEFNCGSYFKNPVVEEALADDILSNFPEAPHWPQEGGVKFSAGYLIEQVDLKSAQLNDHVRISPKHALVMTTDGAATCEELLTAEDIVKSAVYKKFGIEISREPNYIKSTN
jgi:UDP-N-acetylmuramate dehydrogenase